MPRIDVNRSGDMEAFVQVVERGGFSAAAQTLCMTPSAVSKLITRLEARLGTRLLNRSTRKLQITSEGTTFYEHSTRVLADMDEAERSAAASATPRGRVSVNASMPTGHHLLLPLVPAFHARFPDILLDISLTDRVVDLLDERADVAIRWGALASSQLVARRLGDTAQVIVGAPAYLARHGAPQTMQELAAHQRLGHNYKRNAPYWPLRVNGQLQQLPIAGYARVSDGEALRHLALAGAGLARMSVFHIQADIKAGRLVPVAEHLNPGEREPIHAVFLGKGGRLPARVRVFLDFLVAEVTQEVLDAGGLMGQG
ncbi:LysR substrate-binding domain-containing protein [Polaromonas sp. P1(28)-13]|nr:LysR substrate-binding domain-containing protein [Polaromonas sp. P1-6]UUZ77692.1 LysR substrate-binding domain-containing protein [Polaromonas sp. P1(28)-13]